MFKEKNFPARSGIGQPTVAETKGRKTTCEVRQASNLTHRDGTQEVRIILAFNHDFSTVTEYDLKLQQITKVAIILRPASF